MFLYSGINAAKIAPRACANLAREFGFLTKTNDSIAISSGVKFLKSSEDFAKSGLNSYNLDERSHLEKFLDEEKNAATVVILGARDPSLADWCQSLTKDK